MLLDMIQVYDIYCRVSVTCTYMSYCQSPESSSLPPLCKASRGWQTDKRKETLQWGTQERRRRQIKGTDLLFVAKTQRLPIMRTGCKTGAIRKGEGQGERTSASGSGGRDRGRQCRVHSRMMEKQPFSSEERGAAAEQEREKQRREFMRTPVSGDEHKGLIKDERAALCQRGQAL